VRTTAASKRTRNTGAGLCIADLPTACMPVGTAFRFACHAPRAAWWEDQDFSAAVIAARDTA